MKNFIKAEAEIKNEEVQDLYLEMQGNTCEVNILFVVILSLFLALCKRKNEMEVAVDSRAVLRRYHPYALKVLIVLAGLASVGEYVAYTLTSKMGARFPYLWITSFFVGEFTTTPLAPCISAKVARFTTRLPWVSPPPTPAKIGMSAEWISASVMICWGV